MTGAQVRAPVDPAVGPVDPVGGSAVGPAPAVPVGGSAVGVTGPE